MLDLPEQRKYQLYLLFAAIFISFFLNANNFPLFDVDEGAFSAASLQMVQNDDYVAITLNGEPRYDKPIMIYWLQSTSIKLFGSHNWTFRLPSSLAAFLWALTIFWFARKYMSEKRALLAALMMATTIQVALIGKAATADATLNLFIAASLLNLFLYLETRENRSLYWMVFFTALGTLTKGPIAPALPVIIGSLYCFFTPGRWKTLLTVPARPLAWLIYLAIILPWPIMIYLQEGAGFFKEFLFVHNVGRFSSSMEGHGGSYAYYIIVMLVGFVPYTAVLISTFIKAKDYWQENLTRYALIWFGFIFLFFTFSATKLPHYMIYGSSGLFILMALHFEKIKQTYWLYLPQIILASILFTVPWLLVNRPDTFADKALQPVIAIAGEAFTSGFFIYLAVFIFVSLVFSFEKNTMSPAVKLVASGAGLSLFLSVFLLPAIGYLQQKPVVEAGTIASQINKPLVNYQVYMPSFNVYAGRASEIREPVAGDLVFTKHKHLEKLTDYSVLFDQQGFALIEMHDAVEPGTGQNKNDKN